MVRPLTILMESDLSGKVKGLLCVPILAVIYLVAAIAEPTMGGEIAWLWWLFGILGGFSLAGSVLRRA